MRVFLRLEQLFLQFDHFMSGSHILDHRATISTLVDILQIFSRHDLKAETLKELERHANRLHHLSTNQEVDTQRLKNILNELSTTSKLLYAHNGKIDISSMQSTLFQAISQRNSIPAGNCSFDIPAYHFWLQQPAELQQKNIHAWVDQFAPIRKAIELTLSFLRLSGKSIEYVAKQGFFQESLETTQPYQLAILQLNKSIPFYAEISGGKQRITIRFMNLEMGLPPPTQANCDIPFKICYCIF
jgi:cell division protein ZapD